VWGIDGNFAFHTNVYLSGYVAQSKTRDRNDDDFSYRAQFNYTHDRYGLSFDHLVVEPNFNPEIGLIRRQNFRRSFAAARFSPRTANHPVIRKWTYEGSIDYITDTDNLLETRDTNLDFRVDFHNSDALSVGYQRRYDLLKEAFGISENVSIPSGGYTFDNLEVSYNAGAQHRVSGTATFETGSFYDGDRQTVSLRGRVDVTPRFGVEPNLSLNWIDLPGGSFTDRVIGTRATFTMTPRMFVAALVQYSSSSASLSTNLRFRWEYGPGSELFVVYSEGRSTLPERDAEIESRGFVFKINRLFRF
jgi:hypothetical protein